MKGLSLLAWWLVVIGALNWLLIGLGYFFGGTIGGWNVVYMLFGSVPMLENLVYVLIGLSGVLLLWNNLNGKKK